MTLDKETQEQAAALAENIDPAGLKFPDMGQGVRDKPDNDIDAKIAAAHASGDATLEIMLTNLQAGL
jgi:hypothetical protein